MKFQEIECLIQTSRYEDAWTACESLLKKSPSALPDVCRLKSRMFTRQGKYGEAVVELAKLLESGDGNISDYHSAAFWSLFEEELSQSRMWFEIVVDKGEAESNSWFNSSSLFYLAYICYREQNYSDATNYLERSGSESDDTPIIIPEIGSLTRNELRQLIKRKY